MKKRSIATFLLFGMLMIALGIGIGYLIQRKRHSQHRPPPMSYAETMRSVRRRLGSDLSDARKARKAHEAAEETLEAVEDLNWEMSQRLDAVEYELQDLRDRQPASPNIFKIERPKTSGEILQELGRNLQR